MSDFDRPLDNRGLHDAPLMAKRVKKSGYFPDVIFSSDALRAKTTAEYFSKEFNVPVHEIRKLYHGQPEDYMSVINATSDKFNTIMLFGHNPGITILANLIKRGCTDNIPTCGVLIAQYIGTSWAEIDWQKMNIIELMFPKDNVHD